MTEPGELIGGRYKSAARIGYGGMGQVWTAYDQQLDRRVAVKLLRTDLSATAAGRADLRRRFERECRITARLDHPGLVTVYDAGAHDDELYLVMQLVEGISLADLIAEESPFPWPWAVAVSAQMCAALAAVHAVPMVHRDLKPSNALVRGDGRVVLLDLGIAAVLEPEATRLTQAGDTLGSPHYMAPEQALSRAVEPRSDLYALGCMLHEMVSGSTPFAGGTALGVLQRHLNDPPVPLRQLRADVPEPLERLVLELLAKEPEQRPESAQEVYRRLAPFLPTAEPDHGAALRPGPSHDPTRPYRFPLAPQPHPSPAGPAPDGGEDRLAPPAPEDTPAPEEGTVNVAEACSEASRLVGAGRFAEAVDILAGALPSAVARHGEHAPVVRMLRKQYARTLLMDGQFRRALPEFRWLVAASGAGHGPHGTEVADFRFQAAVCLEQLGDNAGALAEYRELLPLVERSPQPDTARAFELRQRIGQLLLNVGDRGAAREVLVRLLADKERLYGPGHPEVADLRATLDWLHRMQDTPVAGRRTPVPGYGPPPPSW